MEHCHANYRACASNEMTALVGSHSTCALEHAQGELRSNYITFEKL